MRSFAFITLLFITLVSFGQDPYVRAHFIAETQKLIVPIRCLDSSTGESTGTGVILTTGKGYILFLTCEHVIAVKDSNKKTIAYKEHIYVDINDSLSTEASSYRTEVIYSDDSLDFALLRIHPHFAPPLYTKSIQRSLWRSKKELRDGESVLYCGYPMGIGIGEINRPLSRMGMIAQVDPTKEYFIVDGFVQHGHSGSPVFLVRQETNTVPSNWEIYLIGLMKAYPTDKSAVYEDVKLKESETLIALTNSGFSYVVPMDEITKVIDRLELTWR